MVNTVKCTLAMVWVAVALVGYIDLVLEYPVGILGAAALVLVSLAALAAVALLAVWLGIRRACLMAKNVRR